MKTRFLAPDFLVPLFSSSKAAALLMMAALVSGCAGDRDARVPPPKAADLSAPDAILSADQVRDAKAAIHLGVARCFPRLAESAFQAELQQDHWFVWADLPGASFSAEVAKSDGAVSDCHDIQV